MSPKITPTLGEIHKAIQNGVRGVSEIDEFVLFERSRGFSYDEIQKAVSMGARGDEVGPQILVNRERGI